MKPEKLDEARRWLKSGLANDEQTRVLKIFERTFGCYIMESEEAKTLREDSELLRGQESMGLEYSSYMYVYVFSGLKQCV